MAITDLICVSVSWFSIYVMNRGLPENWVDRNFGKKLKMTEEELTNREHSSFFLRHMLSFLILLSALAAFLPAMQAQMQRRAIPAVHHASIERNGFFYGEDQYYLVTPPLIHVYYLPDAESDAKDDQRAQESAHNSDKYRHEIFVLVHGKWMKKWRAFSKKPELFLHANSCDTKNELDLPGRLLSDALPRRIKIKKIEDHQDYAVVVYSDTPDRDEYYALKTALLERGPHDWYLVDTIFGGDAVHFCGTEEFHARSSIKEELLVLLIYSGDLSTDGQDFISIQSLLVRVPVPKPKT